MGLIRRLLGGSVGDGGDEEPELLHAVTSREELAARLRASRLADHTERLLSTARDSVRLHPVGGEPGRHRLGGEPDLPPDLPWPRVEGRALSFITQVGLEQLAPFDPEKLLPRSGTLSFFHEIDEETGGLAPEQGASPVLHLPGPDGLVRTAPPRDLAAEARFRAVALAPAVELTTVGRESPTLESVLPDEDDQDEYLALAGYDESVEEVPHHRLLGHPDEIQGSLQWEAQHEVTGRRPGHRDRAALLGWRLLLQVDSDEDHTGMLWGDVGRLFWMIRDQDLRAGRFDRTVLIGQCY